MKARTMASTMIEIDGSQGEGGGQILRSSLALAMITGKAVRFFRIRARRRKPGLMRQHLTAVQAAAQVCNAQMRGAKLGSTELIFEPGAIRPGDYCFAIGTAGSSTLVLQTVLLPLLSAEGPSSIEIEGGTHNPLAPPFDFVQRVWLPILRSLGAQVDARLLQAGFYPAGGGKVRVELQGGHAWTPLELLETGALVARRARALVANLPISIATRELSTVRSVLGWTGQELASEVIASDGPGNVLMLESEFERARLMVTRVGEKGVRAERVAEDAAQEMKSLLEQDVPVCEHLADQLILPLALGRGGRFRTVEPSLHTRTNAEIIGRFIDYDVVMQPEERGSWIVTVSPPAGADRRAPGTRQSPGSDTSR